MHWGREELVRTWHREGAWGPDMVSTQERGSAERKVESGLCVYKITLASKGMHRKQLMPC